VVELVARYARWDAERGAQHARSPRRVLAHAFCFVLPLAALVALTSQVAFVEHAREYWICATTEFVLLAAVVRLSIHRWRREVARPITKHECAGRS
jgi:hypothetical protein